MAFGTLRVDSIQNDGGTAKTVANLLDATAIGSTLQGFDADTAKTDVAQNYTAQTSMTCLLYTSPSPRDRTRSRMPSSA